MHKTKQRPENEVIFHLLGNYSIDTIILLIWNAKQLSHL